MTDTDSTCLTNKNEQLKIHADEATLQLKALANANRLMIMCSLAESELSVGELNQKIDLSQSALSQHLAKLREDGLVTTRRDSQTIYYRLRDGVAKNIINTLHDFYCA
ncbi:MAG: metalloregulator ArsR/SmtB family transcription factor [Gammaproteobacteria bacterium]|nr:metalloregulator ArsR/SmtB family transcription factor [Gammaproteobacteria bacterium]MDH5629832.1 metalloregulator ArsR/SmtB family transcription factor [Gammaproteobacteria bacterium]